MSLFYEHQNTILDPLEIYDPDVGPENILTEKNSFITKDPIATSFLPPDPINRESNPLFTPTVIKFTTTIEPLSEALHNTDIKIYLATTLENTSKPPTMIFIRE